MVLSERQEFLLGLIVREYVESAQPIGSKFLMEKFKLDFSSATIRNEMVALTESGYLRQPHTSAGRVPTEEGYRYFVQRLLGETDLPTDEKRTISHQFFQARRDIDQWMRLAASILAQHSSAASLVTAPSVAQVLFRHVELIAIQNRQALMVLVLQNGEVEQQYLTLEEPLSQPELASVASTINSRLAGSSVNAAERLIADMPAEVRRIAMKTIELMRHTDFSPSDAVVHDGLANVMRAPEFADQSLATRALRILEERNLLSDFLGRMLRSEIGGVHVVIGGEGDWEDLRDCALVISRYGAQGVATGAVGVIGPTRMAYGRTISAVRYVSSVMSDLVSDTLLG